MPDLFTDFPFWSLVVSALALVVSIWAHYRMGRLKRESNTLQERLVELEEEREADRRRRQKSADLSAQLEQRPGRNGPRTMLVIENSGRGLAENVRVQVDGTPIHEHGSVHRNEPTITKIGSGSESSILISTHADNHPPFDVRVQWDDATGTNHTFETTLTGV
jgi:hypothetical protein